MTIEERVLHLERQMRLWRGLTTMIGLAAVPLLWFVVRSLVSPVVKAERFELVGVDGKSYGDWHVNQNGPYLRMQGNDGGGVALGVASPQKDSVVRLWGPGGSASLYLSASQNLAHLGLRSPSSPATRVGITQNNDSGEITLFRSGTVRGRLRVDPQRSYLEVKSPGGDSKFLSIP